MFVMRIMGGLGNQLFQYAYAKSISHRYGVKFYLDSSFYETQNLRGFSLREYPIMELLAAESMIPFHERNTRYGPINLFKKHILRPFAIRFLPGKHVLHGNDGYDPSYIREPQDSEYMEGYFCSYKYFWENIENLRALFQPKERLPNERMELLNEILACESVSLHVRRTDFVALGAALPVGYYEAALNEIVKYVPQATVFVFSDDIAWARENIDFHGLQTRFVDPKGGKDVHDLHLMSRCRHGILANSTFSYWSGYLRNDPRGMIFVPKENPMSDAKSLTDSYLESWIQI